jgi:hypothetical protein
MKYGRINIISSDYWEGDLDGAWDVINRVSSDKQWNSKEKLNVLLTPAGFLREILDNGSIEKPSLDELETKAKVKVMEFLKQKECARQLGALTRYLALGIDIVDGEEGESKQNGKGDGKTDNLAEFVVLIDLEKWENKEDWWWTGKSYPNSDQEKKLERYCTKSHRKNIETLEDTLILVCHDLEAFHKRWDTREERLSDWRRETRSDIRNLVKDSKIDLVLHLYHKAKSPHTWTQAWNNLFKHAGCFKDYIGCGVFSHKQIEEKEEKKKKVKPKTVEEVIEEIKRNTGKKGLDVMDFNVDFRKMGISDEN